MYKSEMEYEFCREDDEEMWIEKFEPFFWQLSLYIVLTENLKTFSKESELHLYKGRKDMPHSKFYILLLML